MRNQKNIRREIVNHSALMHPHIIQFRRWEAALAVHLACTLSLHSVCKCKEAALLKTWSLGSQVCGDGGAAASNLGRFCCSTHQGALDVLTYMNTTRSNARECAGVPGDCDGACQRRQPVRPGQREVRTGLLSALQCVAT